MKSSSDEELRQGQCRRGIGDHISVSHPVQRLDALVEAALAGEGLGDCVERREGDVLAGRFDLLDGRLDLLEQAAAGVIGDELVAVAIGKLAKLSDPLHHG